MRTSDSVHGWLSSQPRRHGDSLMTTEIMLPLKEHKQPRAAQNAAAQLT
jgi:hypothetical protein